MQNPPTSITRDEVFGLRKEDRLDVEDVTLTEDQRDMRTRLREIRARHLAEDITAGRRNSDGTITRLAIIQESGMQLGPSNGYEGLIRHFISFDDLGFGLQYCAKLNVNTDLPFYLAEVKVQVVSPLKHIQESDLANFGLKPLPPAQPTA